MGGSPRLQDDIADLQPGEFAGSRARGQTFDVDVEYAYAILKLSGNPRLVGSRHTMAERAAPYFIASVFASRDRRPIQSQSIPPICASILPRQRRGRPAR